MEGLNKSNVIQLMDFQERKGSVSFNFFASQMRNEITEKFTLNSPRDVNCHLRLISKIEIQTGSTYSDRIKFEILLNKPVSFESISIIICPERNSNSASISELVSKSHCGLVYESSCDIDHDSISYRHCREVHVKIIYAIDETLDVWPNRLGKILETGEYSDLVILVNDKVTFNVHKNILCQRNKVLKTMIDINMLEKSTSTIRLYDVSPESVKEFLKYMYTDFCDASHVAHDLFRLAHLYGEIGLQKICVRYLMDNTNFENIIETLKLVDVDMYDLDVLRDVVGDFVESNEVELVNDENFRNYLLGSMTANNIYWIFDLTMRYNLEIKDKVKQFIKQNEDMVMRNNNFKQLISEHPHWNVHIFY